MQSRESEIPNFDLPEEVLAVLPSDPFEQLDVARKITSIALATRVSKLESEVSWLRREMNEKEELIAGLQSQIESLDASLDESNQKFARVEDEKENLLKENSLLQSTVKKLNRDVSKLEVFRKTLMQSLREEEDNSQAGISKVKQIQDSLDSPSGPEEEDYSSPTPKSLSVPSQPSTPENSLLEDGYVADTVASKTESLRSLKLGSQNITPRLTPPPSPPRVSTTASPTKWSNPVSPRRHSISFSYSRSNDNRSFKSPSTPPNQQNSLDTGYQPGRNRVDGKEFFRQVRSRLSYEQFAAFLANVKELNAHKQTKEETLLKANEIFGPDNKDLYAIFESLITRNLQ